MSRNAGIWAAFAALALYGAGVATGIMVEGVRRPDLPRAVDAQRMSQVLTVRLARDLDLSRDQQQALERLVEARRHGFMSARAALRQRLEADAAALVADLRGQLRLTADQQARFDVFVSRVRAQYLALDPRVTVREENGRARGL